MVIGFLHNPRRDQAPSVTSLHQSVVGDRIRPAEKAHKGDIFQVAQPKASRRCSA